MYLAFLYIDYFEDYLINYHEEVEALVSNDYEDIEKIKFKQYLENGIYLISQNRYTLKLTIITSSSSFWKGINGWKIVFFKNFMLGNMIKFTVVVNL